VTLDEALDVAANTGNHSRSVLVDALHVLAPAVEAYRAAVTTGGPPPRAAAEWANVDLEPPATALDDTAPPLHSPRSSTRLVGRA
jgi:hypothetical protein